MQDYEKLGVFYLGKQYDLERRAALDELLLYDSKDLTTHAICVGMTGSGKTGLCLALLEEAAIDNIPSIMIDPKGDLANLLLTFPELRPVDFEPWVDAEEAQRAGMSTTDFAAKTAQKWREGLSQWHQDASRIADLRNKVDLAIYTPGGSAGLPLAILRSFSAPPPEVLNDTDAFRTQLEAAASGLLGLVGIKVTPSKNREHLLVTTLLDRAWRDGKDLDIGALIAQIQKPPIDKIGLIDVETVYPAKDRFELAMQLNNLLASPSFANWMVGESLEVKNLLYTSNGKPRMSIISIAHLSDRERMFFVTILLNEVLSWVRSQPGTSSLRAILYMDEVFGYFPPTANPPSKLPMLTLLKQARAFGLGIVLATQNPADLDYKGLANAGTWFLGRLQAERDKLRVLEGLEGASVAAGRQFDRQKIEAILSALGSRVFLMNNVHEDHPVVFQTRWTLSYLRGPLTRDQIAQLMASRKQATVASPASPPSFAGAGVKSVVPPEITERFVAYRGLLNRGDKLLYRPALFGECKIHFVDAKAKVDQWQSRGWLSPPLDGQTVSDIWESATALDEALELESAADDAAQFAALPSELAAPKKYDAFATDLKNAIYRTAGLSLFSCPSLKQSANPGETEGEFRARLVHQARESRDAQVAALREKYAGKLAAVEEKIRKQSQRLEKEKSQARGQMMATAISIGSTILNAVIGRKKLSATTINKASTAMRSATRTAEQQADVGAANETLESLVQKREQLNADCAAEVAEIEKQAEPESLQLSELQVKPKKADIVVDRVSLIWLPYRVDAGGSATPAY